MILTKLRLKNFKRFKIITEFNLEISNSGKNIILIEALNGVGKTSFLQAVQGAFFGLENSDFKKYLNYEAKDEGDLSISMELEYKDNDFRKCSINRTYISTSFDGIPKESIRFSIDGDIKVMNTEEWNDYLNRTFPKEISNFFFFDGEKIQYLVNPNDPKKVKSAIEKVLGIETIRNLKEDLIDLKSEAFKRVNSDGIDRKIQIKQSQLNDYEDKKDILKIELADLEVKLSTNEEEKRDVLNKIELLAKSGLTREKIDERSRLLSVLEKYNNEISIISESIEKFKNEYLDVFLLTGLFNGLQERIDKETQIKKNIVSSNIDDDKLNQIIQALYVPVCIIGGEKFDLSKNDLIREKIKSALSGDTVLNTEKLILDLNSKDEIALNIAFSNAKKGEEINLNEIVERKSYLQDQIDIIKKGIQDIDRQTTGTEQQIYNIDELYANLSNIDSVLLVISTDISIKTKDLAFIENEIKKIQRELEVFLSQVSLVDEDKKYFDLLSKLIVIFETHIEQLILKRKEELEQKTFEMFQKIAGQNVYKKVEITDDYGVKLVDYNGIYQENLSSGYNQILMTSLLWGLEQLSGLELPIIIDTPLARLDPVHRKNMLEKYFADAGGQVIILSQPSEITEQDKDNKIFTDHLKNNEYISMDFDEEKMQSFVSYKSIK